jgi:hypothetical protein
VRRWVVLTMAVTIGGTGAVPACGAADVTAFQASKPGELILSVMLNGQGPFAFILDTGSSHSSISETLAAKLGAPAVAKSLVRSSTGLAVSAIVRIDRMEVGPSLNADVLASPAPAEPVPRVRAWAPGGVGMRATAGRSARLIATRSLPSSAPTVQRPRVHVELHCGPGASASLLSFAKYRLIAA